MSGQSLNRISQHLLTKRTVNLPHGFCSPFRLEQEHHCSDCSYSPNGTRVHFSISVILCVYVPFQCLHCPKSIILPFAFRLYHPTSDIRCKTFRIDHETVATRSACCQPSPGRANVASPTRKKQTTQPTVDGRNPIPNHLGCIKPSR